MLKILMLLFSIISAEAMNYGEQRAFFNDREGTQRTIGIIAYGSLINEPTRNGFTIRTATNFENTGIGLPISMTRYSSANTPNRRITAVIDNTTNDRRKVYCARSYYKNLRNARANLAAREGVAYKNNGYDFTTISYMKKLAHNEQRDSNETRIAPNSRWVMRIEEGDRERVQLSSRKAQELAKWADDNGYDALIWATFPSNRTSQKILQELRDDSTLLSNTVAYIQQMPGGATTSSEREIMQLVNSNNNNNNNNQRHN